jgi:hypothetical protein
MSCELNDLLRLVIGEDFDASLVSWLFQWIQQYQASNGTESSSTTNT